MYGEREKMLAQVRESSSNNNTEAKKRMKRICSTQNELTSFPNGKEDSIQLQKKLKAIIASDYTPNDSYLKRFVNEFGTHTRTFVSEVVCVYAMKSYYLQFDFPLLRFFYLVLLHIIFEHGISVDESRADNITTTTY